MPGGRPTKYDPAIGQQIVELMAQGHSLRGACGKLRVSRTAVHQWEHEYPEFANAVNMGRDAAAAWWEERAVALAQDKDAGSAPMVIFGLKNRVSSEWRDKVEQDQTVRVVVSPEDAEL